MTPGRRHDDPTPDVDPDEVDEFFGSLPLVIKELHEGRRENRLRANQVAAGVLFVFAVGILFGWVIQHQQDQIRAAALNDRRDAYVQCRLVNDNAARLNDLVNTLVMRIEQADLPPAEKARAIGQYRAVLQTLPVCRKP